MDKKENVRKYELVVVLDAKLGNDAKDAIIKETIDIVAQTGAKVINNRVWLEKQKFTFPIKKCHEGTYYLINIEGNGQQSEEIRKALRLREKILRFLIILVK
jgi:ribosomal protein S6